MNLLPFILGNINGLQWAQYSIGGILFLYWLWAIIEVTRSRFEKPGTKATWLIIVLLLGSLGAFIYHVSGRQYRIIC